MKSLIIYFSDVHLTGMKPENEGAVIAAFCEDVKQQLIKLKHGDVFVLIGGDLVQAADDMDSYQMFYDKILKRLIAFGIDKNKIFAVPGNHDCERQWIIDNRDVYAPVVDQNFTEDRFDDVINSSQGALFTEKFRNYSNFINHYLPNSRYNPIGYPVELNEEWSLYCLNSALTSFAGYELFQ